MVLKNLQPTDLNSGGILATSNVHNKAPLEPSGEKLTQIDVIRS